MHRALTLATLAAILIVAAPANAATTTIRACVKPKSGAMRMLLTATGGCRKGERKVSWQATGVQGLPGPKGDTGAAGATGPKGDKGDKGDAGGQGPAGPIAGTPAGGALTGTFPSPSLAPGAVDAAAISGGLLDGPQGTPTLRSLGTGAVQAAAGNDPRLSNSRAPTGAAGGALTGTFPSPSLAASSVGSGEVADGSLRIADLFTDVGPYSFGAGQFSATASSCNSAGYLAVAAQVGDVVIWNAQDVDSRLFFPPVRVEVANRLPIRICNVSAAGFTLPAITIEALLLHR